MFRRLLCLTLGLTLVAFVFGFCEVASAQVQLKFNSEDFPGDGADNPTNYNILNWRRNLGVVDEDFEGIDGQGAVDAIDFNTGLATGISLSVTSETGFNEVGPNRNGALFLSAPASNFFDDEAAEDNLFGHDSNFNVGAPRDLVEYSISGLNSSKYYDFTMFGSRFVDPVADNRETKYEVAGTNSGSDAIDVINNGNNVAQVLQIQPTAGGQLTFTIQKGPNNTNSQGFFYLGAFEILENGDAPQLGLAGDYNGDLTVDAADYTTWLDNLGATEDGSVLNGNGDGGTVGSTDYDRWKANFGGGSGVGTGAGGGAVPEPSSVLLLILGLLGCSQVVRSRDKSGLC